MMSRADYLEILRWITARYPSAAKWNEETIVAYFDDLKIYSAESVFSAVKYLHKRGRAYAPNSSEILKALDDLQLFPELTNKPQLNGYTVDPPDKWISGKKFAKQNGYKNLRDMIKSKDE